MLHKPKEKTRTSLKAEKFHALVFVALSPEAYKDPEKTAEILAKHMEVECVDIVAGDWELVLEIRTKDQTSFTIF
jgi:hypothetical protein